LLDRRSARREHSLGPAGRQGGFAGLVAREGRRQALLPGPLTNKEVSRRRARKCCPARSSYRSS